MEKRNFYPIKNSLLSLSIAKSRPVREPIKTLLFIVDQFEQDLRSRRVSDAVQPLEQQPDANTKHLPRLYGCGKCGKSRLTTEKFSCILFQYSQILLYKINNECCYNDTQSSQQRQSTKLAQLKEFEKGSNSKYNSGTTKVIFILISLVFQETQSDAQLLLSKAACCFTSLTNLGACSEILINNVKIKIIAKVQVVISLT